MKVFEVQALEFDRLRAIVDNLRQTEDGEPIFPGRRLYYLDCGVVGEYEAGGGGRAVGLFSTRKAAMRGAIA